MPIGPIVYRGQKEKGGMVLWGLRCHQPLGVLPPGGGRGRSVASLHAKKQQIHQRDREPGPCVQWSSHSPFFLVVDINRTVSRRSELKSRTVLMDEQSNPWEQLHPQDSAIQHRGRKPPHRCGLFEGITLLSLA